MVTFYLMLPGSRVYPRPQIFCWAGAEHHWKLCDPAEVWGGHVLQEWRKGKRWCWGPIWSQHLTRVSVCRRCRRPNATVSSSPCCCQWRHMNIPGGGAALFFTIFRRTWKPLFSFLCLVVVNCSLYTTPPPAANHSECHRIKSAFLSKLWVWDLSNMTALQ